MEEIGIVIHEKVSTHCTIPTRYCFVSGFSIQTSLCNFQDDQTTDVKGLANVGPQSFDELEAEDLYTKYKVPTQQYLPNSLTIQVIAERERLLNTHCVLLVTETPKDP